MGHADAIREFGTANTDGTTSITFGTLVEKTADKLEALNGTLRAAKRKKEVTFSGEILMLPKDKDVHVTLLDK